jgi:ketosteroid isomerase-like protein
MRSLTGPGSGTTSAVELERIVGDGDQVVALSHHRGRGKASGAAVDVRVAYAYSIKDGKVFRWQAFMTWSEALEAAGLSE